MIHSCLPASGMEARAGGKKEMWPKKRNLIGQDLGQQHCWEKLWLNLGRRGEMRQDIENDGDDKSCQSPQSIIAWYSESGYICVWPGRFCSSYPAGKGLEYAVFQVHFWAHHSAYNTFLRVAEANLALAIPTALFGPDCSRNPGFQAREALC